MHFGFALELSDIDLWNTDLLDTHLDLLSPGKYTDIPSKYFVCLHKIFKKSSRHVLKTSSRHVFKTPSRPTNVCWFACCDLIKKKKIRIPCKMSFGTIDKYGSSVILPMFHQSDRGGVQLTNSVGNAWIIHLLYIHTWLKIGKCVDST